MAIKFLNNVAVDSDVLYVDTASNRVGIGTANPDARLHLASASSGGLINQKFESVANSAWRIGVPSSQPFFAFDSANDDLSAPKVIIDTDGNIGVGTINTNTLTSGVSSISLGGTDTVTSGGLFYQVNGTYKAYSFVSNNNYVHIGQQGVNQSFWTNATERMRITSAGNVGIGTTNPDTLLHVAGNNPTIKIEDNYGVDYYNPKIEFFGSSEGGTLEYISNPGFSGMRLHYRLNATNQDTFLNLKYGLCELQSANITGGTTLKTDGVLQVTGSNDSYFSNGNVGVGTTSPGYKLHVNGDFYAASYGQFDGSLEVYGSQIYSTGSLLIESTGEFGGNVSIAGSVKVANDAAAASASNVGSLRYRTSGNNSYVDMCMQTGATTYAWVNIVQNNW